MGQQEYDNFKRLIKEWLDNHPDEYADFVEEMNDKKFKGFFKVFKIATKLAPKYKEAARKRIGDDRTPDFEELENILLHSDLAENGFYMLIFKLSIHFSRIQEKVNRGCIAN